MTSKGFCDTVGVIEKIEGFFGVINFGKGKLG